MANVNENLGRPAPPIDLEKVDTPSASYKSMAARWELIDSLLGGTLKMREMGAKWLPMEDKEKQENYERRLSRSFLFNGYSDTIRRVIGKPFSRPVSLVGGEDLEGIDPRIVKIEDDADGDGTNLTNLAKECMGIGLNRGLVHLLVDFPQVSPGLNLAQEKEIQPRPLFIPIDPENVILWSKAKTPDGKTDLAEVRIIETAEESDPKNGGTQNVRYLKIWTKDGIISIREDPKIKKWGFVNYTPHTFGRIPILTCYFNRTGFMQGVPPLEDLAWLNLAHWQSNSDQRNILRFARCGLWLITGMTREAVADAGLVIGPNQWFAIPDVAGDMKVVEHSGAAIEAGRKDLIDLEERMQIMGLQPFVSNRTGEQTATGKEIDEARATTDIQCWIRDLEAMFEKAYSYAIEWLNGPNATEKKKLEDDFRVNIFSEFGLAAKAAQEIQYLINLRLAQELDRRTFWDEMRRRGLVDETLTTDEIIDRIESEEPALLKSGGNNQEEDEEDTEENKGEDEGKEKKKGKGKDEE